MKKRFRFTLHADCTLGVDEIWPDGDAPENPTLQDVLEVAEAYGWDPDDADGMAQLMSEWNMLSGATCEVFEVEE